MKTSKERADPPQVLKVSEIVQRVRAHIARSEVAGLTIDLLTHHPRGKMSYEEILDDILTFVDGSEEVAGFTIGVTGQNPPQKRLNRSDHKKRGRLDMKVIVKLDRDAAHRLEHDLQMALQQHLKYEKLGKRYVRSGPGKTLTVYVAWRHISWRPEHNPYSWAAQSDLLTLLRQRDNGATEFVEHRNEASLCAARFGGPQFMVSIGKEDVHWHRTDCGRAWTTRPDSKNPNPHLGKGRRRATSSSFFALIPFAKTCPPDLADKDYWHLCPCLKKAIT
jgi:hypothetical protein